MLLLLLLCVINVNAQRFNLFSSTVCYSDNSTCLSTTNSSLTPSSLSDATVFNFTVFPRGINIFTVFIGTLCINHTDSPVLCVEEVDSQAAAMAEYEAEEYELPEILEFYTADEGRYIISDSRASICMSIDSGSIVWIDCDDRTSQDNFILSGLSDELDTEVVSGEDRDRDESWNLVGLYSVPVLILSLFVYKFVQTPEWMADNLASTKSFLFRSGMTQKDLDTLRLQNLGGD